MFKTFHMYLRNYPQNACINWNSTNIIKDCIFFLNLPIMLFGPLKKQAEVIIIILISN